MRSAPGPEATDPPRGSVYGCVCGRCGSPLALRRCRSLLYVGEIASSDDTELELDDTELELASEHVMKEQAQVEGLAGARVDVVDAADRLDSGELLERPPLLLLESILYSNSPCIPYFACNGCNRRP